MRTMAERLVHEDPKENSIAWASALTIRGHSL